MSAVEDKDRAEWQLGEEDLPVNPFTALRVSYGMLLGEDDFRTLMGDPRGKLMLHNAWLHGSGVIWGFPIVDRDDDGLMRVGPGLAMDTIGRTLALQAPRCIDVERWLAEENKKGNLDTGSGAPCADDGPVTTICLVATFDQCPTRPVPALADPCDLQRTSTEASRLVETVRLELRPHDCPAADTYPYHRVRVLLGLDEIGDTKADEDARKALRDVVAQPPGKRPRALLDAFRRLLALDVHDLRPEIAPGEDNPSVFPVPERDAAVPLARITVARGKGNPSRVTWTSDITVRRSLMPTSALQELACALAPGLIAAPPGDDPRDGPRVRRDVGWDDEGQTLVVRFTKPLKRGSLSRNPISVTSLGETGWDRDDIDRVEYDGETTVRVKLFNRPSHEQVRLIVRGTGPTPVTGTGTPGVPLAGLVGGPPGTPDNGHDAVLHIKRWTR